MHVRHTYITSPMNVYSLCSSYPLKRCLGQVPTRMRKKSITNCICGCCHSTFNVCLPALPFFPSVSNLLNLFSFSMLEPANCRTYPLSGSAGFFLFLSSPLLKIGNSLTVVVAFGEASVAVLKKNLKKVRGILSFGLSQVLSLGLLNHDAHMYDVHSLGKGTVFKVVVPLYNW